MRTVFFIGLLSLAACQNQYIPLPVVEKNDPVRQLNPTKWVATVNDLIVPPPYEAAYSGR